jgi:acetolactate synthase-1/2/3 large subunit
MNGPATAMTGAEAVVRSLIAAGVDTCLANPGTSEMHFVAALDRIPGLRCVLGLHENVVTGMADGYARVTGRPAATLLHCGPGLGNGLANLHNARRAASPVVNIVGDHALPHMPFDSPLTADTPALARSVSSFVAMPRTAAAAGEAVVAALAAACTAPQGVATVILPADAGWGAGGVVAPPRPADPAPPPDPLAVATAARHLRAAGRRTLILLGTRGVAEPNHPVLAGIAAATGATLMASSTVARQPRGRGRLVLPRVPYPVDIALAALDRFDTVVLVDCPPPTAFFGYPGRPSLVCRADAQLVTLARPDQDAAAALAALAAALGTAPAAVPPPEPVPAAPQGGVITPDGLAATVCALLPDGAIVIDEALTLGTGFARFAPAAAPHDWLTVTGGAIGGGLPLATGAALGAASDGRPDRRVVALQADGSAAYTLQALWTQARERLPCTTVLLNNRSYAILLGEYEKVGATPGPTARSMMDLDLPAIDWVGIARGFGVAAERATTLDALGTALRRMLAADGPGLIDAVFPAAP